MSSLADQICFLLRQGFIPQTASLERRKQRALDTRQVLKTLLAFSFQLLDRLCTTAGLQRHQMGIVSFMGSCMGHAIVHAIRETASEPTV